MTSRIVIIGGGQAGGWAAKTLRDEGFDGEICVVAEEEWDFYERPPLSKASLLEPDAALPRLFSDEVQQALNLARTGCCALNLSIAMRKKLFLATASILVTTSF